MRQSFFDYCRQYHKEALLREWDTARNAPLTPQMVSYGSHTPVWWRCANGHEWEAVVYTRTHGSGCPFCAGRKLKQALTIWRRKIQSWRNSGIMQRTFLYCRQMLRPAAIG